MNQIMCKINEDTQVMMGIHDPRYMSRDEQEALVARGAVLLRRSDGMIGVYMPRPPKRREAQV